MSDKLCIVENQIASVHEGQRLGDNVLDRATQHSPDRHGSHEQGRWFTGKHQYSVDIIQHLPKLTRNVLLEDAATTIG